MSSHAPQPVDLLVRARWVVPVEPEGVVLEDHAVAITAGRIIGVTPGAEAASRFAAATVLERPGHVLLPGLVNTHTHAAMTLLRGLADDLPLGEWLERHVWPAEARWVSAEFVRDGARLAMLEMIRSGTTCFSDMYFFPEEVAALSVEHHMRAMVGLILIEQPSAWARTPEEYFARGLAVHDQYKDHPLVTTQFAPHAPYTVSDTNLRHLRLLADELDIPVHMHVHETADEVARSLQQYGRRPLQRLDELGLLSAMFSAVHATELDDQEIALLALNRASVIHCPESNLKLASGFCPVGRLIRAGVNVALGTDGAASNNDLDLFGEMRTAALLAKAVDRDPGSVPAQRALSMATLHGARALGLGDQIGSLLPGKWADMICVDLRHPATQPVHHVVSQLVYAAAAAQVTDAWIAGRAVLEDGCATTFDQAAVLSRAEGWRQRLGAA